MADQWLSIVEYARCFNISDMTVRRRIKNGKLHAVLKEGKYYIPIADDISKPSSRFHHSTEDIGEPEPREFFKHRWDNDESEDEDYFEVPNKSHHKQSKKSERLRYPGERYKSHFSSQDEKRHVQAGSYQSNKRLKQNEVKRPQNVRNFSHLPKEITGSFDNQAASMIETEALLEFCNTAMRSLDHSKKVIEESFKNKVEALEEKTKALEAQLGEKDLKVEDLKQKVEDFQLLIKIIESAKKKN